LLLADLLFIKLQRAFSAIALDHAHEQLNARIKGVGGAVGLTENTQALNRWMVAGPEIARAVEEFEITAALNVNTDLEFEGHHEQTLSQQSAFYNHVLSVVTVFEEMGNPFLDDSTDLFALDTMNICSSDAVKTVFTLEATGLQQYSKFVKERLKDSTAPVTGTITHNKISLFKQSVGRATPAHKNKLAMTRNDCSLFSRLYISCQTRNGDLDTFFAHENQLYPPSLSCDGKLRLGTKSDLLICLENLITCSATAPQADCLIVDGAALVQMLSPARMCRTFEDYGKKQFIPYLENLLKNFMRVDIIWDQYMPDSLKASTRAKRGKGVRRRVVAASDLPRNWADFLHVDENKTELFHFLSQLVSATYFHGRLVLITDGSHVLSSAGCEAPGVDSSIDPCSHEEADTRMLLHAAHAARAGCSKVMIRTVDTDVVVIAVACCQQLALAEFWIWFGVGKNVRYLAVHDIATALKPDRCLALPFFHAFTGCDTVSAFVGRGKKVHGTLGCHFPMLQVFSNSCLHNLQT
jgi:hypothetical protein